jgi:para-aminobenzoate synthetase component I
VEKMNTLGQKSIPFLFVLDFELKAPVVVPLSELGDDILYKVNQQKNYQLSGQKSKDLFFNPRPISFERFSKAFHGAQKEIFYGNSFLFS